MKSVQVGSRWVALLMLSIACGAQAKTPVPVVYELDAIGEIEIATDGSVRDYRLQSELKPAVAAMVDKQVRSWSFEPILVDGKRVIGKTRMHLVLSAAPAGEDSYALKIDNVWFGQPQLAHRMQPPKYPMDAVYAGLGAKVVLVLKLDPQGNVVEVFPEQISLTATGKEPVVERWRRVFEKVSVVAAKRWKFNPTERIGGQPIASVVRVPVMFELTDESNTKSSARWNRFVPGPVRPLPWMTADYTLMAAGRDALKEGEAQPLSSRFRLKDNVVGRTL